MKMRTYTSGIVQLTDSFGKQNRPIASCQSMTALGLMSAQLVGPVSSLDGINRFLNMLVESLGASVLTFLLGKILNVVYCAARAKAVKE